MASQQQSIKRFFAPKQSDDNKTTPQPSKAGVKRKCSGEFNPSGGDAGNSDKNDEKEVDKEEMHKVASPLSSPEVKKRATDNQVCAKIKLRSKELSGALHSNIGPSWFQSLQGEFKKPYFVELSSYLEKERAKEIIYPPGEQVWTWTRDFEVKDTKVVILGQDPYHGPGQAHGLCFSVQKGTKIPPSLVNMYKELKEDENVDFVHPGHGFLQGWADQGVLLLNACLTVQKGHANSHKDRGWEKITDKVIKAVSDECPPGVVFLLWGSFAQKKAAAVDSKKHHLLKTVHPSPLSAHRGFIGSRHFSKCNELLKKSSREPIDWAKLP